MTVTSWVIVGLLLAVSLAGFLAGYWIGRDVEAKRAMEREDQFLTDLGVLRGLKSGDQ